MSSCRLTISELGFFSKDQGQLNYSFWHMGTLSRQSTPLLCYFPLGFIQHLRSRMDVCLFTCALNIDRHPSTRKSHRAESSCFFNGRVDWWHVVSVSARNLHLFCLVPCAKQIPRHRTEFAAGLQTISGICGSFPSQNG